MGKLSDRCNKNWPAFAVLSVLIVFVLFAAGCGGSTASEATQETTASTKTKSTAPQWPDIPVTIESAKTVVMRAFGINITPKIAVLRDLNVTESSPGRFKISVSYNQPGMCHNAGGSASWQIPLMQQYAYVAFMIFFQQPQIDTVTLDGYATSDPAIDDPAQFEKVEHIVVERSHIGGGAWEADRAYASLPSFATEYWLTPKAK